MLPMIARMTVLSCLLLLVQVAPVSAANPDGKTLKIGMIQTMFRDVQPSLVKAMSRPLRSMIEAQTGLTGDVEVVKDAQSLADQMKKQELGLGVFHGFEYAWLREEHPNIIPLVVTEPSAGKMQAVIVVHKSCPAKTMADLKPDDIVVPKGSKAHCILFAERSSNTNPGQEVVIARGTQTRFSPTLPLEKASPRSSIFRLGTRTSSCSPAHSNNSDYSATQSISRPR